MTSREGRRHSSMPMTSIGATPHARPDRIGRTRRPNHTVADDEMPELSRATSHAEPGFACIVLATPHSSIVPGTMPHDRPADQHATQTSEESLREFASRPWEEIESLKREYWANTAASPAELIRAADELRRYTLSVRPDWPDEAERKADLKTHIRVSHQLGRSGNG